MSSGLAATQVAPVAITTRSGFDESVHHGVVVVLDAAGGVAFAVGDHEAVVYPRSSNKPMQADAMLRLGLELSPEQLALACASHAGTPRHIAIAHSTLVDAGLDDDALGNTAALPLDKASAEAVLRAGGERTPIQMNCSGKHAAMVATCVANGWPVDGYLEVEHPVQVAITEHIESLAGPVTHIGVDGCGAPAHAVSLVGLARAFRALATDRGPIWQAMTTHPVTAGGDGRDVTRLMQLVPDLMAKDGAEGVFAAALPDGRAAAVKVADGASRASGIVLAAALRRVGVDVNPAKLGSPLLGHGEPVGFVHPLI